MSLRDRLRELRRRWQRQGTTSYSQCGEDLIASFLLRDVLHLPRPVYLDIGTNDPVHYNNTYHFYRLGCRGACVEPNPTLAERIRRVRPRDVCLNAGVGTGQEREAPFHILSHATLSTFSREEAEHQVRAAGQRIERVVSIPLLHPTLLVEDHLRVCPNFVTLDTEGMDLAILKAWDFDRHRPEVICVETLTHPGERKVREIPAWLEERGYRMYADTYINSLFVESGAWARRAVDGQLTLRY